MNRRRALKTLGTISLAAIYLPGCGGDDDDPTGMGGQSAIGGTPTTGGVPGMDSDTEQLIANWESGGLLTPNAPGMWAEKVAGHFPIATVSENTISVVTPHPMDAEHWIEAIYIKDAEGNLLGFQAFEAGTGTAAATFEVEDATIEFTAHSVCNLHGVWVSPPVRSAAAPGPWPEKIMGHTPVAEADENGVTVTVPHPMTADHFIVAVYLTDANGNMVGKTQLDPAVHTEATHTFEVPEGTTTVTPWALCDDHDLWIGETLSV